jgi:YcxB-like protein
MTLKYALTRLEILRFFLMSLALSPRLLITVVTLCLFPGIVRLSVQGFMLPSVTVSDLIGDCYWTLWAFPLLLFLITVRGKTSERTLTVSEEGISTSIGSLKGQVSWSKIKTVRETTDYVLIARSSGNAFFVPERAFSGPGQKAQFLSDISRWRNAK